MVTCNTCSFLINGARYNCNRLRHRATEAVITCKLILGNCSKFIKRLRDLSALTCLYCRHISETCISRIPIVAAAKGTLSLCATCRQIHSNQRKFSLIINSMSTVIKIPCNKEFLDLSSSNSRTLCMDIQRLTYSRRSSYRISRLVRSM